MSFTGKRRTSRRRMLVSFAAAAVLLMGVAGTALASLVGLLPTSAFTFTSTSVNGVDIDRGSIRLETEGRIDVKTTYSKTAPLGVPVGWHYHNGPVIVTVALGTLTFLDRQCRRTDVGAGQSFIEPTGKVINALADPAKNIGVPSVEWFTTRLYPRGALDPVPVAAPCTP